VARKENFRQTLGQIGLAKGDPSLSRALLRVGFQVEQAAREAQRMTALLIDQMVVLGTPVDTGRARSNWRASVGTPLGGVIEPYAPGRKLGLGEGANAAEALNQASVVINSARSGDPIYISNNVHYIGKLERGHSTQNREFVKRAVARGQRMLKKFTLLRLNKRLNRGN
jgi:hypothetical protein